MSKLPFERLSEIAAQEELPLLQTDIQGLNKGGYLRQGAGDLVFLGGRPGSGKTLMALQVAHQISLYTPVLFFSLEMAKEQLRGRLQKSRVNIQSSDLFICDQPGLSVEQIAEAIVKCAAQEQLGLVVIDYAQIVQAAGYSKAEQVGTVVRTLKTAARETGLSILLLAQMSRDIERRSAGNEFAEPVMADFADSSEIEKFADVCLMLHRVPKTEGVYKVFCVKNRHGDAVGFELRLNRATLRFEDHSEKVNVYQF